MKKLSITRPSSISSIVFVTAALCVGPVGALQITDPDSGLMLDTTPGSSYQQQYDHPCVIGGSDCQNPSGLDYELSGSGGGGSVFTKTSPTYTLGQISAAIGSTAFFIGFDYNESSDAQILYWFQANYFNGSAPNGVQLFDQATPLSLPVVYNGVGWSDFLLTGFVLPEGTTGVSFSAEWFNNDGPDSYFLIPTGAPPQVPLPGTLALMGLGAAALGFALRRRRV